MRAVILSLSPFFSLRILKQFRHNGMFFLLFILITYMNKNLSYQQYKKQNGCVLGAMSFKITTCPDTYLFILYMVFYVHIYMVERKFNNYGHQFHQYHQHEQSFLILTKDSYSRKDRNLGRFNIDCM